MELEIVILKFWENRKITRFTLPVCVPFSGVKSLLQPANDIIIDQLASAIGLAGVKRTTDPATEQP
jgi:hypothetical protein